MSSTLKRAAAAIVIAGGMSLMTGAASAMPVDALAIRNAAPATVETVQWRRGWGWGGVGAGFVAGAIIGSALTAPYYGYGPYPYAAYPYPYAVAPGPGYYEEAPPAYGPPAAAAGDAVAYCSQRFRSYDPRSGTYLGYDGQRHPCP
jgi:hypothetical protein